jgi:hypothetical protein
MKKLPATLTLAVIALLTIGYSYACKNGGITINPNNNFDAAFTNVTTNDNEAQIDVATTCAQITPDGNAINAYIINAYPCYEAYITYTIQNKGNKPAYFDSVTITNPNPEALEITTTNHAYTWLQPGQTVQGTTTVHILQEARQGWQYKFQISIGISFKEEHPQTIGFWKHQFNANLDKNGKPQIDKTTLEQYLTYISSQSQVFIHSFTGSQNNKFNQALNILNPPTHSNMEAKLKAQLLALWLNYVSGWTNGYKIDGMTAEEIIEGSEDALLNHQTTKYEYWKNLCDDFNNLK